MSFQLESCPESLHPKRLAGISLVSDPNVEFARQSTIMELHASSQTCVIISDTQESTVSMRASIRLYVVIGDDQYSDIQSNGVILVLQSRVLYDSLLIIT